MEGAARDFLEGKKYPTDLLLAMLWAVIAVIGALALPDGNILRIILGIPLLLFIPGYCVVSALWPEAYKEKENGEHTGINFLERLALSLGLSVAIVSFVGLGLNYTPTGITLASTLAGNILVVLASGLIAYYRRSKLQPDERFSINLHLQRPAMPVDRTERMFVCAIGVALVLSGVGLGYVLLTPIQGEKFTEFYILDANGTTDNYPINITRNETTTVIIGIACHEAKEVNYTVIAGIEETAEPQWDADWDQPLNLTGVRKYARNVTLTDENSFEDDFYFYINTTGTYKIVWQLCMDGVQTDYEIHLWVNVKR